jgi:hypothetical protein
MSTDQGPGPEQAEAVSDQAARYTLALNPLVGLRGRDYSMAPQPCSRP